MEPEEFEDYLQEAKEDSKRVTREREIRFTQGCIEGYNLLQKHGVKCIDSRDSGDAEEAINRMLGYFIQVEDYEKCSTIKKVYKKAFKKDPVPVFPNFLN